MKSGLAANALNKNIFFREANLAGDILRIIPPNNFTSMSPRRTAAIKSNLIYPLMRVKKSTIANGWNLFFNVTGKHRKFDDDSGSENERRLMNRITMLNNPKEENISPI